MPVVALLAMQLILNCVHVRHPRCLRAPHVDKGWKHSVVAKLAT